MPRLRSSLAVLTAVALLASHSTGQQRWMLIDLGDSATTTGNAGGTLWNDLTPPDLFAPFPLFDTTGASTGLQIDFDNRLRFETADLTGVTTPVPGSNLDGLGWPSSALQDSLYQIDGQAHVEFVVQGLDPTATYDFTLVGSSMGFADIRTTVHAVTGAQEGIAILDASGNDSEFVQVLGIRPDASAEIRVVLRADPTNTSPSRRYLLNALGIQEHAAGAQPPLVALTSNRLDFSRIQGAGLYSTSTSVYTNDGTSPGVSLTAVDDLTGLAPTWLTLPAMVTAGTPFLVPVDEAALGSGSASATVTAAAAGYSGDHGAITLSLRSPGGPLNLLFYGNSYTLFNSVPDLVQWMAVDAGVASPYVISRLSGGKDLNYHLTDPLHAAAIRETLSLGEAWDFVVLQGHSTEATVALGDPDGFRGAAVAILTNVRNHSPGARAALYQTWARGQGHSFYQGANPPFSDPLDMHRQIESSYQLAVADMDAAFGPDSARRAAAGETVALLAWEPALYTADLSHPQPFLSVMASQTIFSAVYAWNACTVMPDFVTPSMLGAALAGFGLGLEDWRLAAGYADRVAAPDLRLYPGSGEDFLLSVGVNGPETLCPVQMIQQGDMVELTMDSPAGLYTGLPVMLHADVFPTGSPPGPFAPFPEVQYDPLTATRLLLRGSMPGGGVSLSDQVTFSLPGFSIMLQATVFGPSGNTGNPTFTTSDGHELQF